jgi:signal peptidase II
MRAVRRRWLALTVIALAVVVLDQGSKFLAVKHLTPGLADALTRPEGRRALGDEEREEALASAGLGAQLAAFYGEVRSPCEDGWRRCPEIKVVDGFWSWRYAENKGAAWSMFAQLGDGLRLPLLIGVSSLAVVFILSFVRKLEPGQGLLFWALSLVLGGAVGNLVDRVYLGYVIDFILWYRGSFYWPTFNVADAAISVGVGLIALTSVLESLEARRAGAARPEPRA